MEITKETVEQVAHGHTVVGTSPVQLSTLQLRPLKGVLLRCPGESDPSGNSAPIWVGNSTKVSADSDPGTGGMPILPGSSMFIPIDDVRKLYVVSTGVDQDIAWMLV